VATTSTSKNYETNRTNIIATLKKQKKKSDSLIFFSFRHGRRQLYVCNLIGDNNNTQSKQ
jgi:hypothetical protein